MKLIKKIEFESNMYREHSASPTLEPLGNAKCTMELFMSGSGNRGCIEWEVDYDNGEYDCETIGLWLEEGTKILCDYDGVFSMPKQAIELLEQCGYNSDYAK